MEQTICYGAPGAGPDKDETFGPLALYRPATNILVWVDKKISRFDQEQLDFLRAVAAGQSTVPVLGDAVFRKLKTKVLERPERVLAV